MVDELEPPRKSVELEDTGARNVESSDESDQFTDASEGQKRSPHRIVSPNHTRDPSRSSAASPIPITRVERLDEEPSYGEIPGTEAYEKRMQDAVPDEVEVVTRSRSASRVQASDRPSTPNVPVPRMVVEKIDPEAPAYGDVPGTDAYEKRKADAVPDAIVRSPDVARAPANPFAGSPTSEEFRSPEEVAFGSGLSDHQGDLGLRPPDDKDGDPWAAEGTEAQGGDDFDDFEEGREADDDDDDFGDFGEQFEAEDDDDGRRIDQSDQSQHTPAVAATLAFFPVLDWSEVDSNQAVRRACAPHLSKLFPGAVLSSQIQPPSAPSPTFLADRSHSLYSQLIAPPPLAPPNWLRSRIRRLFLVSLGLPVDLDEILPASKQKKLVLPSIPLPSDRSPRPSSDSRSGSARAGGPRSRAVPGAGPGAVAARLKGSNGSSASVDSHGTRAAGRGEGAGATGGGRRRDEGGAAEPRFDLVEALRVGQTTEAKLRGLSDEELRAHVERVGRLEGRAREVLEWWEGRRESAVKEKEAFEGVIENLVKHARKFRT